jgi:hypothetical protein
MSTLHEIANVISENGIWLLLASSILGVDHLVGSDWVSFYTSFSKAKNLQNN